MKNKVKKIVQFLFFLIIAFISKESVKAGTDYVEGPKHNVNSCNKQGGCFRGTIGFRVTIVNKKTGDRCYYDPNKSEVCVDTSKYSKSALKKLKVSKSFDLWFDANQLNILSDDNCLAVTGKRTKKEYLKDKSVPYKTCRVVYNKAYSMTYLGFPTATSSSYPIAWNSSSDGLISAVNTASNMTSIVVWMLCKEYGTKTVKLGENSYYCKDQNKKEIKKDLSIFSNLFSYSFYGDKTSIDVKKVVNLDNSRIELDQLLEIHDQLYAANYHATIGLVSETTNLYKNIKSKFFSNGCVNSKYKGSGVSCSSYFSSGGYLTGWSASENLGNLKAINQDKFNKWSTSDVNYDNFSGSDTANVFTYWLHQSNTNPKMCETVAPEKTGKNFTEYYNNLNADKRLSSAEKAEIVWMKNADYYGFKTVNQLKTYASNSCAAPSCEQSYDLHKNNKILSKFWSKIPTLADSTQKNLIKNYSDARWNYVIHDVISSFKITSANVCKATRCSDILVNQGLNTKKYNQLDSDKKKIINIMNTNKTLYADFNYKYLNEDILKIFNVKAACDGKLPDCKNIDNISKCESPYNISIGKKSENDATYKKECILNGFLYNIGNKYYRSVNNKYTGYLDQSSLYTVYCSEKIDIEMPKINSSYTKAGRVFQWGKNIKTETNTGADSDTKNFATMTVVQQCYKGNKVPNGKSVDFSPNERKKFKQLNDSLSTSNGQISSTTMDFTYKEPTGKFKFNNLSYERKLVSRKVAPSSSFIEITSVYDFDYTNKMTWYSHKGNSEEDMIDKNKYNSLFGTQKNEYLFIGYGAPTSFNTADGTYKESITATIKNIGVSGEYKHLYSSDILEYKCDFKIHNEIIGNECCDVSTGKPFPGAPSYCTCDGGKEPKGLDVAFRTIELVNQNASSSSINSEIDKAFPGRSGSGRYTTNNIGKNWSELLFKDKKAVLKILRNSIYNEKPQYTISLDVRKISAIRESNKALRDESIDPYTYRGKVKNGTGYTCYENGKYGYCRSEFVKEYLEGKCATRSGTLETKPCE